MKKLIQFLIMSVVTIILTVLAASTVPEGDWFLIGSTYFFAAVVVSTVILLGILWTNKQSKTLNAFASIHLLIVIGLVLVLQLPFLWGPTIELNRELEGGATLYLVNTDDCGLDRDCKGGTDVYLRESIFPVAHRKLRLGFKAKSAKQEGRVLTFEEDFGSGQATFEF